MTVEGAPPDSAGVFENLVQQYRCASQVGEGVVNDSFG
jgi:hypothetical protein